MRFIEVRKISNDMGRMEITGSFRRLRNGEAGAIKKANRENMLFRMNLIGRWRNKCS